MARWPVLVGFSIAVAPGWLGCASVPPVTPGLANAPDLGGSAPVDERVHDVVANGRDSCESVTGRSPLRGHAPPCPTVTPPAAVAGPSPAVAVGEMSLAEPWLEHFYVGFPCPRPTATPKHDAAPWSVPVSVTGAGACALLDPVTEGLPLPSVGSTQAVRRR